MKIYLVKRKKTNVRWFDNDTDLTEFLINAPESLDSYQIITLNAELESEMSADKVFVSIQQQSELDRKVTVALGDEFASKVQRFLEAYEKWSPKTPWDKTKMTTNALKVYEKLKTAPVEEKQFSKVLTSSSEYLIYTIGSKYQDSSEWLKLLIDIYPQLNTYTLTETCRVEYIDPLTRGTRWDGGRTSTYLIKSFEKAKKAIAKEKKLSIKK